MNNTVQLAVNETSLVRHLRMAFTCRSTFLAELLQNARRAGASQVWFRYDPQTDTLTVEDDGHGIEDMQTLLTVAESGWSESVRETESPYGLGFLSALFAARVVAVASRGRQIRFDADEALSFSAIEIENADVTDRTRITLRGIGFDPENDIRRYAIGFPIPVTFNDTPCPRPHAPDALPFLDTEIGKVYVHEYDAPPSGHRLGSERTICYLQGIVVSGQEYGDSPYVNIVHLDPRRFHGRLPDRDSLMNHDESVHRVTEVIRDIWKKRLAEWKDRLPGKDFAESAFPALTQWRCIELLNDVPWLPPEITARHDQYPIDYRDWESLTSPLDEPLSRQAFEQGMMAVIDDTSTNAEEDFSGAMYLFAHRAISVDRYRLHPDHWVHDFLVEVSDENTSWEIVSPREGVVFSGNWVYGWEVIRCEHVVLDGPLGPVEVRDHALLLSDDTLCAIAVPQGIPFDVASKVVRQASSFIRDDDSFDDAGVGEERSLFELFLLSLEDGTAEALLAKLLRQAAFRNYDALAGKTFTVRFPEKPGYYDLPEVDSVKVAEAGA